MSHAALPAAASRAQAAQKESSIDAMVSGSRPASAPLPVLASLPAARRLFMWSSTCVMRSVCVAGSLFLASTRSSVHTCSE